jgi:hypothetical protein
MPRGATKILATHIHKRQATAKRLKGRKDPEDSSDQHVLRSHAQLKWRNQTESPADKLKQIELKHLLYLSAR